MTDKTQRIDDAMSVAEICDQFTAENEQLKARLAGIVEAICGDMEMRLSERQRSRIRALAPAVAEKVNAGETGQTRLAESQARAVSDSRDGGVAPTVSSDLPAPIPQPVEGVAVPRQLLAECRDDVAECMGRESKPHRIRAYQEQLAAIDALLAAAQEPRK